MRFPNFQEMKPAVKTSTKGTDLFSGNRLVENLNANTTKYIGGRLSPIWANTEKGEARKGF